MNRAENDKVIHFPVGIRRYCDMIMQVSVPVETNKITPVGPLLKSIDASGYRPKSRSWSHLTPSASGGRRREIRKGKRLDYLMNVQKNRPGWLSSRKSPLTLEEPGDVIIERARPNHEAVVLK